jgi:acyl carrier protein
MPPEELKERIREMLVTNLMLRTPKEEIANDLPLFGPDGLGLDSIDALQLVVSLEKTFGVGVPNSEVARSALATVNSIHDYILEHKPELRKTVDGRPSTDDGQPQR